MTPTPRTSPRQFARRFAIGALVAGVSCLTAVAETAGAAPRTSSATIASEADRALVALDRWSTTQNPADYVRFVRSRELTAELTASDLDLDADRMRSDWATAPTEKQATLLAAMSQLGVPYQSIASKPGVGFDCSGLTIWAFGSAGVEIPRVSGDQIRASERVDREAAQPGDLVHYPGHVGIYLGVDTYVHSPEPGRTVEAERLPDRSLNFGELVD